jgi:hypothetical protein
MHDGLLENLRFLKLIFVYEAPYIVGQLYGVPHGILRVFLHYFYTNMSFKILKFQTNHHVSPFPEQFTLVTNFSVAPLVIIKNTTFFILPTVHISAFLPNSIVQRFKVQ